jgi:hypothetical protein
MDSAGRARAAQLVATVNEAQDVMVSPILAELILVICSAALVVALLPVIAAWVWQRLRGRG